jgi:hypothetical protein
MASRPKEGYNIRQQDGQRRRRNNNAQQTVDFVEPAANVPIFTEYIEPATFEYKGLQNQKRRNYDQFLRSNIDNEQDNRNFNDNEGRDHLPFRSFETGIASQEGPNILTQTVAAGGSLMVPLRWNNPHASELEANIWITHLENNVVVPIKKPTCSGEGYQDNIFKFTVPADFAQLESKIPGFKGCKQPEEMGSSKRPCVLQVYSHSVESRTYAIGIPIIITGHVTPANGAPNWNQVLGATASAPASPNIDTGVDLTSGNRRTLCLPSNDPSAHITTAVPRIAKMFSDVYNHAYMNSDFSPYQGQQQEAISQNLQAAAVNKMVTGNRGELGKAAIPNAMKQSIKRLANLENKVYKAYEAIANKIINRIKNDDRVKDTAQIVIGGTTQNLANCFRCATVGSTNTNRLQTNTYIPSYELPAALVATAQQQIPQKYKDLLTIQANGNGLVQIYKTANIDLADEFAKAAPKGIIYQMGVTKEGLATKYDPVQFKKRTLSNNKDNGVFAGTQAIIKKAAAMNCAETCLKANNGNAPLLKNSQATSVTGSCKPCEALFQSVTAPVQLSAIAMELSSVGGELPDIRTQAIEDYPDVDGSPREGRPTIITTTTTGVPIVIIYRGGGSGGSSVVGGGVVGAAGSLCLNTLIVLSLMLPFVYGIE